MTQSESGASGSGASSRFASRTNWPLEPNRLTTALQALRARGVQALDLTESNPTQCRFDYPADELLAPFGTRDNLRYEPEARGLLTARECIAKYYGERGASVDPEQIVLTAGTSQAYSWLFRLLANPGDRALAPAPSYPLFQYLADLDDVQLDRYPLTYQGHWRVDVPAYQRLLSERTKAAILLHPNNPTGSLLHGDDVASLAAMDQAGRTALICDEVFADYLVGAAPHEAGWIGTMAGHDAALTFTLGGISKALGLPQMKLGWIVVSGPQDARAAALTRLELIADTYLSVSTPAQLALPRWFELRDVIQRQITTRVKENYQALLRRVEPHAQAECLAVQAGWYATVRLPDTVDEEALCLALLEQDHVLAHPGYFYDFPSGAHLVMSLLPSPDRFQEGVERVMSRLLCAE